MLGRRRLASQERGAPRHTGKNGFRRAARPAHAAGGERPSRHQRQHKGGVFPRGLRHGGVVRQRTPLRAWRYSRQGMSGGGRFRPAGARHQYKENASVRAQFRIFFGGSVPERRTRGGIRQGRTEERRRRERETFCREQSGNRPHGRFRGSGRKVVQRNIPFGV